MQIIVPREEIVARAKLLYKRSQPVRVQKHRKSILCDERLCVVTLHLGGDHTAEAFCASDPLEGKCYSVMVEWDVHGEKPRRIYAIFPGVFGDCESVDVTEDVLGSRAST